MPQRMRARVVELSWEEAFWEMEGVKDEAEDVEGAAVENGDCLVFVVRCRREKRPSGNKGRVGSVKGREIGRQGDKRRSSNSRTKKRVLTGPFEIAKCVIGNKDAKQRPKKNRIRHFYKEAIAHVCISKYGENKQGQMDTNLVATLIEPRLEGYD